MKKGANVVTSLIFATGTTAAVHAACISVETRVLASREIPMRQTALLPGDIIIVAQSRTVQLAGMFLSAAPSFAPPALVPCAFAAVER